MANTSGESGSKLNFGGPHLKRVAVNIQFKNHPETIVPGYALSHEILAHQVSFFAPQKFPVDEELNVFFTLNGEKRSLTVTMKSMHEQISSGRIMNALPTEANPFPARKFYRCYSAVVGAVAMTQTSTDEAPATVVTEEGVTAPEVAQGDEAPVMETAATVETVEAAAPPIDNVVEMPKKPTIDPFAADDPVSVPIPDVA